MSKTPIEQVADAILYEGYLLYPYRPSAVKNRQRWTVGGVYPRAYSEAQSGADAWQMQTECLLVPARSAALTVRVRFLHLLGGQEATEREVRAETDVGELTERPRVVPFAFPASGEQAALLGEVELFARDLSGVFRVTVCVRNVTPADALDRAAALRQTFVSAHAILHARGGAFVSLLDPPEELRGHAGGCRNVGAFPVLGGAAGQFCDTVLASPIILYDHPQVAPESPGDLFDATEIDEILTLRILTLTDEEKRELSAADGRARALLERTEALAREQLLGLHGALRGLRPAARGDGHE